MKFRFNFFIILCYLTFIKCQSNLENDIEKSNSTMETNESSMEPVLEAPEPTNSPIVPESPLNTTMVTIAAPMKPNVLSNIWTYPNHRTSAIGTQVPFSMITPNANIYRIRHPITRHGYMWLAKPVIAQDPKNITCHEMSIETKRNFEKALMKFDSWYLKMLNHDIMFSVCGSLLPSHRIMLESTSSKFSEWIKQNSLNQNAEDPIVIENIAKLLNEEKPNEEQCPNENLLSAFKIFLRYFYVGSVAFDSIDNLDVSFMLLKLVQTYINNEVAEEFIEPKIIELMGTKNLNKVYQFSRDNLFDTLKKKWSNYIRENSASIGQKESLPFSCEEITNDDHLLDNFFQSLNSSQTRIIQYIKYYLNNCSNSIRRSIQGSNSFPNSLLFFECTIDDLKELLKMEFITTEMFAEELENRLRAKIRNCEESKSSNGYNQMRQMEPCLTAFQGQRV